MALNDPAGARAVTSLACDRVAMSHGVGLCLKADHGVVTTYRGEIFDSKFHVTHDFAVPGLPSRARVSPDGRYAAMTLFVYGDSYAASNFSTCTLFVDTRTGRFLSNIEQFDVTDNGHPVTAISRNYWGVTFAADSRHFYATLAVGASIHLIYGDLERQEAHTIADGVECPSLSPDGTRIGYKLRTGGALDGVRWRLHVLDLRTGADRAACRDTQCRRPGRMARQSACALRGATRGRQFRSKRHLGRAGRRIRDSAHLRSRCRIADSDLGSVESVVGCND